MTNTPYGGPDGGYGQGGYGTGGGGDPYGAPSTNPGAQGGYGAPMSHAPGGGFYPAAQPVTPKKSRWPLWTCLGCGVLALIAVAIVIVVLVVGGLRDDDGDRGGSGGTPGPTTTPATTAPGPTDPAPTTDPAPAGGGSAPAPAGGELALGATGTLPTSTDGTIDVTVGQPNWDATAEIAEANPFNEPPGPGEVYVTVPVTITYHGPGELTPWLETTMSISSPNGQVYSTSGAVSKEPSIMTNDITDGGTVSFTEAFLIPADQVGQGTIIVEPLFSTGDDRLVYATA
ncbi:hypothetical protein [Brachybacterium huguangmaarense]